jgi:peptidase M50B-like protein
MPFDPSSRLVDLMLGLAALATVVSLGRSWKSFWDDDFTDDDRHLANQGAVFLVPPVVVLLHEMGHVVAAWAVGAEVTSLRYGFFEGSVTVAGMLTPAQDLAVALAGNVVGAVVGAILALVGSRTRRLPRSARHLLMVGGLLEMGFTLVGYPLLSFSTRFGDWQTVYDFRATPELSLTVAIVHVVALAGIWRWWRVSLRPALMAAA